MVERDTEYFFFGGLLMGIGPIISVVGGPHEPWILLPLGIVVNISGLYLFVRGVQTEQEDERAATAAANASADRSPRE